MTPELSLDTLRLLVESDHLPPWAHGLLAMVRIGVIVSLWWLLSALARRIIRLAITGMEAAAECPEDRRRIQTLGRVFRYIASVVLGVVTVMLVLNELGVSIAPILATAGVAGVAVGFGAQSLVKDYFTGLFLLLENQIREGDVVKLGGHAGLVEVVTLRYVQLRDYDGNVHFVPSGEISTVVNYSRGHAYAVMDIGVSYREDADAVMEVMRDTGARMRGDPAFEPLILEPLEIAGVERWDDSAVVIRCRFKCAPLQQWTVRREYLRRLKRDFDDRGIEIPFPHMTLYAGRDKDGQAPPWPLRMSR